MDITTGLVQSSREHWRKGLHRILCFNQKSCLCPSMSPSALSFFECLYVLFDSMSIPTWDTMIIFFPETELI